MNMYQRKNYYSNIEFVCILHDLKTPVYAQKKILELFLNNSFGIISLKQREVLLEVQKSLEYLQNLISDLSEAYLSDSNKIEQNREKFLWKEFLEGIIGQISVLLSENQFSFDISEAFIYADKFQLKRAVINLISNAIKYSAPKTTIYINSKASQNELIFTVINKSSRPLKKDLFYDKFKNGSKLGLYIVKQIIELHSGVVFSEYDAENNCIFGFKLPIYGKD